MRTGLTDEIVAQLVDYERSELLADKWKAALRLTDFITSGVGGVMPEELFDELREHFSEAQVLRLGALLAICSGWQRMIEMFGIRPDHYEAGQQGPWTGSSIGDSAGDSPDG